MKIGIYGGSFNPIHYGHIKNAKHVLKEFNLDKIFFVPVGIATYKMNYNINAKHRIELIKLAIENNPKFFLEDVEIRLNMESYTYDVLEYFKKKHKNAVFYEIIGEDSYEYLNTWKNIELLLMQVKFIVLKRKNLNLKSNNKNIVISDNKIIDISATNIRDCLKSNKNNLDKLLPIKCINYILNKGLYNGGKKK